MLNQQRTSFLGATAQARQEHGQNGSHFDGGASCNVVTDIEVGGQAAQVVEVHNALVAVTLFVSKPDSDIAFVIQHDTIFTAQVHVQATGTVRQCRDDCAGQTFVITFQFALRNQHACVCDLGQFACDVADRAEVETARCVFLALGASVQTDAQVVVTLLTFDATQRQNFFFGQTQTVIQ